MPVPQGGGGANAVNSQLGSLVIVPPPRFSLTPCYLLQPPVDFMHPNANGICVQAASPPPPGVERIGVSRSALGASATICSRVSYTCFDSAKKLRYPCLVGCHCKQTAGDVRDNNLCDHSGQMQVQAQLPSETDAPPPHTHTKSQRTR